MTAHWNADGWPAGYEDDASRVALVKELHLRKTAIFNELIEAGEIPLRKGVLRLIDEALGDGVPVGVCSTSSEQAARRPRPSARPPARPRSVARARPSTDAFARRPA